MFGYLFENSSRTKYSWEAHWEGGHLWAQTFPGPVFRKKDNSFLGGFSCWFALTFPPSVKAVSGFLERLMWGGG